MRQGFVHFKDRGEELVLVPLLRRSLLQWNHDVWRSGCIVCSSPGHTSGRSRWDNSRGSFRTVGSVWCTDTCWYSMAVSGPTFPPGLRGFPYYGVVPETESIRKQRTKMSALSLCEYEQLRLSGHSSNYVIITFMSLGFTRTKEKKLHIQSHIYT